MANIFTSSIGKKFMMSITGLFLMLFLTLHAFVNGLYLISPDKFKEGCDIMSLSIVSVMTPILAAGFILHIIYALYLSWKNFKARGKQRYEVKNKIKTDNWAAKNMFILGVIILGFIAFHLTHFWAKMQLQQFKMIPYEQLTDPRLLMTQIFGKLWVVILYIIWFVALWFHLTHGFWSAFQTLGWNNEIWIKRLKVISYIYATLICAVFVSVAITAFIRSGGIV